MKLHISYHTEKIVYLLNNYIFPYLCNCHYLYIFHATIYSNYYTSTETKMHDSTYSISYHNIHQQINNCSTICHFNFQTQVTTILMLHIL